jgi:ribosomal protein L32
VGIVNSTMTEQMNMMNEANKEKKDGEEKNPHKSDAHKMYNALRLSNERFDPKLFICVERNDAFQIKMESVDNLNEKGHPATFGVVLYLNGQRVHGKKTMRRYGWFQGFKKGNGMFS